MACHGDLVDWLALLVAVIEVTILWLEYRRKRDEDRE